MDHREHVSERESFLRVPDLLSRPPHLEQQLSSVGHTCWTLLALPRALHRVPTVGVHPVRADGVRAQKVKDAAAGGLGRDDAAAVKTGGNKNGQRKGHCGLPFQDVE